VFVAYGDRFLPSPADYWSYKIRTSINNVLVGSFEHELEEKFENGKIKQNRIDKITNQLEEENRNREKK
jgi:hypothetical protein